MASVQYGEHIRNRWRTVGRRLCWFIVACCSWTLITAAVSLSFSILVSIAFIAVYLIYLQRNKRNFLKMPTAIVVSIMVLVVAVVLLIAGTRGILLRSHITSFFRMQKVPRINHDSFHDKWIVVTTIFRPTEDIKHLSQIPGWRIVVVGDRKTPKNWKYPNCHYVDVEAQRDLGLHTVDILPEDSYTRKNVGYLFAIMHGAKVIYETDDDNHPLDLLKSFTLESSTSGLKFGGESMFNPYRHFGQTTLWPRGYPLTGIGANVSDEYLLAKWKTPLIQQGLVNGDPDVDAIFRLTRKKTTRKLDVQFDSGAPPAIVPAGVFAPFNSQNTLFLYDAFWALVLPVTTTFRMCDIWRGYWAQRLLWEIGGTVGFYPPNAYQDRNIHSYFDDAVEEKDMYFQTEKLIPFLKSWKCSPTLRFFDCIIDLTEKMAIAKFWGKSEVTLIKRWIKDLRGIGYKEPVRIPISSKETDMRVYFQRQSAYGDAEFDASTRITRIHFRAIEQDPPMLHPDEAKNYTLLHHATVRMHQMQTIWKICPEIKHKSYLQGGDQIDVHSNILLVVEFNHPHYELLPVLEAIYRFRFPRLVYCGENYTHFLIQSSFTKQTSVSFIEASVYKGYYGYECIIHAMNMNFNVDGYLYVSDDVLFNVWNISPKHFHQNCYDKKEFKIVINGKCTWGIYNGPMGKRAINASLAELASGGPDYKRLYANLKKYIAMNIKHKEGGIFGNSDIYYIVRHYKQDVTILAEVFRKNKVYLEIAVPHLLAGIEPLDNVATIPGRYLTNNKRKYFYKFFDPKMFYIHPVKFGVVLKEKNFTDFLCKNYFARL